MDDVADDVADDNDDDNDPVERFQMRGNWWELFVYLVYLAYIYTHISSS
jgi:hypothetical protein